MRTSIVALTLMGLGLTATAGAEDTFGPASVEPAAQSFKLGALELTAVRDAQFVMHNDAKVFGVDAGAAAVGEVLKAHGLPEDRITLNVNALLVRTGRRLVLLDSGLGPKAHGVLLASLKAAGVSPEAVTDIVITHSHFDHVGGLLDANGKLAFSKATIRMSGAEWEWMKTQTNAADLVKAIQGHVTPFSPGRAIAPGVTPIALDGHTPGHTGYEIASGKMRLLDIGDMAHSSVISLAKPDWKMGFDKDAALAIATRRATFAKLAKDQEFVFAPHFPFPGVGHVAADGEGFQWNPGTP